MELLCDMVQKVGVLLYYLCWRSAAPFRSNACCNWVVVVDTPVVGTRTPVVGLLALCLRLWFERCSLAAVDDDWNMEGTGDSELKTEGLAGR